MVLLTYHQKDIKHHLRDRDTHTTNNHQQYLSAKEHKNANSNWYNLIDNSFLSKTQTIKELCKNSKNKRKLFSFKLIPIYNMSVGCIESKVLNPLCCKYIS